MSDQMFDDVGVLPRTPYKFGDWRRYAVHDENNIKGFFGIHRWLSNFHPCEIEFEGMIFPSTENAYQAAKIIPEERTPLVTCTPYESKKVWKKYTKIDKSAEEWDARKYSGMVYLSLEKYNMNIELRNKLLATGNKYLEETNHWGDSYWGVDIHRGGENILGKVLMNVRTFWAQRPIHL